ncbi:NAD(P)-dependent oxidoreductase [Kitasatospora sp. NPDC006697]|uniref:NAD(P)-dependent oxidoreductase n=1 Tax=Kitasatospora sp. NPDC006697 TaxID=3364020 RepID=UPI0036BAA0D9
MRVLLLDAAPGVLLDRELARVVEHGLAATLNLRRVERPAEVRGRWGGRIGFTDFDPFDERALIAELCRDGLGYQAVKSRAGVPFRAPLLAAAGAPGLREPLRVIGRAGAGTDHVDLVAAARHGVTVTHTPGSNAGAVAEFALAQLLALTRDLTLHHARARAGRWGAPAVPARELGELALGILGFGRIGSALAQRAQALGMSVRTLARPGRPVPVGVTEVADLSELLSTSDVLSLHLPLTERTRGLIGATELRRLPPGAILLNTARGGIVDEQALADALHDPGHPLAAAAVDTFAHEHAAFASPLLGAPHTLLTPHLAGMTATAMAEAALRCADQIAALLAGRPAGVPVVS